MLTKIGILVWLICFSWDPCISLTSCRVEELLIDFREPVGQHTGENMASAIWETISSYGLASKVSWRPLCFVKSVHLVYTDNSD